MNFAAQFGFQHRHAVGRTLNVGSSCDPAGLGKRGAVNVDLHWVSPATGVPNVVNVLADARALPFAGQFDTVVLGDILEHLDDSDIVRVLREAKTSLSPGGRIVATVPDDHRSVMEQARFGTEAEYAPGVHAFHLRGMPLPLLHLLARQAGLRIQRTDLIHYPHFDGWGLVIC